MTGTRIHSTAIIDPDANLGVDVEVGPWVLVGPDVEVGDHCRLGPRVTLQQQVRLGSGVRLGEGTLVGGDPQDTRYLGEETWVEIGDNTAIREYCTINRGTTSTGRTVIGSNCFLMTYVHVAHDCRVGDHVVIANATQIAGHVTVQDHAIISGLNGIHQFVTIGEYSFVGGGSRVNQDVPPFTKAVGSPIELYGLNTVGLQRAGVSTDVMTALKRAYRIVFNSDLSLGRAIARAREEVPPLPEVERFLSFVESSGRGVPGVIPALPIGVIGVGALGRHHARHLAASPEATLVGVFDTDRVRAREVAAACGCRAFDDLEELLGLVRAVTVAVPTPFHAEVGLRVLRRGIPMLMEKPLAATLPEADALIAEAAKQGVQLQVGHIERFNQALRAAEPLLHHPLYLESQRLSLFQPRGTDVAVVLDLMIHDLDLILHLTGGADAIDVRASGVAVLSQHLDMANARVEFQGGVVANVTASRVARDRVRRLRIFQANGYLSLDLATGRGDFMRLRDGWRPGVSQELSDIVEFIPLNAPEADALSLELHSFLHAVRGDREAVITGEEGRAALALALRVTDAVTTTPLPVHGGA